MSLPDPKPGLVIHFSYLWAAEHEGGRTEGLKDRPCRVIHHDERSGVVYVCPITHSEHQTEFAIKLTFAEQAAMGLDDAQCWIVLDEFNGFTWPGHDIRKRRMTETFHYGFASKSLYERARKIFVEAFKTRRVATVAR